MQIEKDPVSGRNLTGHEWDGIKELDSPVPVLGRMALWGSVIYSVVCWVLYPAWPLVGDFTRGITNSSAREDVIVDLDAARQARAATDKILVDGDIFAQVEDADLRRQIEPSSAVLFNDNCAACHGTDLQGQRGFPNLRDDHWLWSGSPDEVEYTIAYGINASHDDSRSVQMMAYGRDELLEEDEINAVIEYVLSLSDRARAPELVADGAVIFEDNCASCHGEGAVGGEETGAPSLTDAVWIYGDSPEDITETIWNGRAGEMPAWDTRLTPAEIRKLALYVKWQGGND